MPFASPLPRVPTQSVCLSARRWMLQVIWDLLVVWAMDVRTSLIKVVRAGNNPNISSNRVIFPDHTLLVLA